VKEINKAFVAAIAIAGIFIILIGMCPAMPGPVIRVEPLYLTVTQGDTFTINITVEPDGIEIGGVQCGLDFDSNLLNATSQIPRTFLSQDGASTMEVTNKINNTIGKIEYGEFRTGVDYGVTSSDVLATITFNATEPGTSSLSLSNVVLSDPHGYQISGVSVNNGTCDIEAIEQTPTPTPTPTPTSGGGDSGNGGTPITPTPTPGSTPTPTSISSPAETPGLTPTLTPTINPVPPLSPSSSSTISTSPTTTASMPSPTPKEHNRLPGFEAAFGITGLLVISYFILKRKKGWGNKK
jgi:hypothetical protein